MAMPTLVRPLVLVAALLVVGSAHADEPGNRAMPEWEQLTEAQRETLLAPVRERWNRNPEDRSRIYHRAERWQSMSPEQRARAHRGMKRWEHMDPERRAQMRALFERTRDMPRAQRKEAMVLFHEMLRMSPQEREQLRESWGRMTAEERTEWMREHAPRGKGKGHGRHRDGKDARSR